MNTYWRKIRSLPTYLWRSRRKLWQSRKQVLQYLLFVVLSTIVWFLIKLNHEYTIEVSRELVLDNTPFWLRVVSTDAHQITYRVKGGGFGLLKYRGWFSTPPLHINYLDSLRSFSYIRPDGASIVRQDLSSLLSRHLPPHLELVDVVTDSVHYRFDWQVQRRLPVVLSADYRLADQCILLEPPRLSPDSISVMGVDSQVEALEAISTTHRNLGELGSGVHQQKFTLLVPSGISVEQRSVLAILRVEQYTEKVLSVPIHVIWREEGAKDSVRLIPNSVEVTCQVPLSYYDSLTASVLPFRVSPDTTQELARLRVEIDTLPSYVHRLRFSPMYVDYYISKP